MSPRMKKVTSLGPSNGIFRIPLYLHGKVMVYALVDEADAERVHAYRWTAKAHRNGFRSALASDAARRRELGFGTIPQLLMGAKKVRHLDNDPLNCRRSNLQVYTHEQQKSRFRSGAYLGVTANVHERTTYQVSVHTSKGQRRLGTYDSEERAARVYDRAALILYGENAALNFPDSRDVTLALPNPLEGAESRRGLPRQKKIGKHGFRGVICTRGRYQGNLAYGGRKHYTRCVPTAREAAALYDELALRICGAHAITNASLGLLFREYQDQLREVQA